MGFVDAVNKASEPTIVELTMILEDGKRAAVKCRPLISIDYFSVDSTSFNVIPILTGVRKMDDLPAEEQIGMYGWMRELVRKSVIAVRDIRDKESIWQPVVMDSDDIEKPFVEGDNLHISVRMLEEINSGSIAQIAAAIMERTNMSREMEAAKSRAK